MRLSDATELLLLAAVWGGSFLFMRMAAPVLGPVWLIEARVLLAGLALLPLLLRSYSWADVQPHIKQLFIVGCVNSALPFLLLAFASVYLPAGFTSILNGTAPLFGMVIAAVWLSERLTVSRLIGLGLGFAGVVILIGWQALVLTPVIMVSVVAALMGALAYAIAAPYTRKNLSGVPPIILATVSQLSAAIALLPLIPFTVPTVIPSLSIILAVLALALFSTSMAYILYFRLIQNIGSTRALTVTYLVPVFAVLWGSLVLGEPVTGAMLLGGGFVLLGTAIANELFTLQAKS